ncbi:MAG: hypothetical protein CVU11_16090 [Bacteroidetes bacterium HGW-Bacteroidetes-6]|nr:MAG: hypothetical protein CVU11_16090 [Bacteroidetes bacterium HGW-Bacteroidetes-6]
MCHISLFLGLPKLLYNPTFSTPKMGLFIPNSRFLLIFVELFLFSQILVEIFGKQTREIRIYQGK